MLITLNPDADVPVFQQIHDEIVLAIARGQLLAGEKLDPVRHVAADIGINPATVKKAYDLLVADGLVETVGRYGSIVRSGAHTAAQEQQVRQRLRRVAALARAQGFSTDELHGYLDSTLKELS
ncbi:GntR family transcriptional regulator [Corynebacterium accolens]|uniref:GntR family transcriptional regulator n=1 Tax=Corynebacterium accolens TaxID=38284 RepID=UPI00254ED7AD|nr:GntR family transcriptional regulator [Corynebacterium accolens]MDK8469252.1 GntR family transcriptional regulator [Corynebacterium accolens]MDK8592607.1 GntR family transcriptional regulator [Corynebacterium accolens]MDK8674722.1 GntR family transcriptional regulator [Corynebacterium accolens]